MADVPSYNRAIDFALSGHSSPDKLNLLGAEYNRLSENGRRELFDALAMRLIASQAYASAFSKRGHEFSQTSYDTPQLEQEL